MSRARHEKSINILENEQFRFDSNAKASAIAIAIANAHSRPDGVFFN